MAALSFALLAAHKNGISIETLAHKLDLPIDFVETRIEAARLTLLITSPFSERDLH